MEPTEVQFYNVWPGTEAIACINHPIYRTMIYDRKGIYYSRKSAKSILKKACINGGATYEGRITHIRQIFGYDRRTPLPVDPAYSIYTFPTCSPINLQCAWLFDSHIHSYEYITNKTTKITFDSGHTLIANISIDFLRTQMEHTAFIVRHYGKREFLLENEDD